MIWQRVHLCTGILEHRGRLLLVASRYRNLADPVWNLPGGRQEPPETIAAAVVREFREETSLAIAVTRLAYVAESFDSTAATQFTNVAFEVELATGADPHRASVPPGDAHAVACQWVPLADLATRLTVAVVREPLLTYLSDRRRQYFGFGDPGITIEFAD